VVISHVWLFSTLWTVICQFPLSTGFSRQEYWSGLPFPTPEDFPGPGIEPTSLSSSALPGKFFATEPRGKPYYEESWAPKNWCFWTVVLEKTLESPLACKGIQLVHPKGNQSWILIERNDAEAKTPILWPPDAKNWLIGKDPDAGKDWRWEEKWMTEDEMVGWHHRLMTHVWVDSRSWWWKGRPDVLQSMGSQKVRHDWATELEQIDECFLYLEFLELFLCLEFLKLLGLFAKIFQPLFKKNFFLPHIPWRPQFCIYLAAPSCATVHWCNLLSFTSYLHAYFTSESFCCYHSRVSIVILEQIYISVVLQTYYFFLKYLVLTSHTMLFHHWHFSCHLYNFDLVSFQMFF